MKKILVLCDAGTNRSVMMAKFLRERGHFAVAGSYENWEKVFNIFIEETLNKKYSKHHSLIKESFDIIIFMQEGGEHFIGRDLPETTETEWQERFTELSERLGL